MAVGGSRGDAISLPEPHRPEVAAVALESAAFGAEKRTPMRPLVCLLPERARSRQQGQSPHAYSGSTSPLPPNSFGKSLNFGSPSFTDSTFSA